MVLPLPNLGATEPNKKNLLGQRSFILWDHGKHHFWQGEGALSIKTFPNGRALYNIGRGTHAVGQNSYLILNHRQTYSISVDSRSPVESFCLFFAPGFIEQI